MIVNFCLSKHPCNLTFSLVCFVIIFHLAIPPVDNHRIFTGHFDPYENRYANFDDFDRTQMREEARRMFEFAYDNYMRYAFPMDELDPIHCAGRGPDYENPANININDVLGDYCLSLVDSLTTLVVMGNKTEFFRAVQNVLDFVSFDKDNTVQVFEATIRVLGALLSAHMIITDPKQRLGDFRLPDYNDELLSLAHDLAERLLPAFENTKTGLPYPRINLMYGVPYNTINETCTAGAGSLLLEFGVLSRLLGDPTFEGLARRTNKVLWDFRDNETGLLGNVLDIQTGEWIGLLSGLGAGLDSFYEYMIKAYILFGDVDSYKMFNESYAKIKGHLRRGRDKCNAGEGDHPIYVNVHMRDGTTANTWIDALQASFAGVQILNGDIEEAICQHALYYTIWRKYGALPERFNWKLNAPDVAFYPLRPEFAESTYFLYMATKNPFYLHVGKEIIENLNSFTKVQCGYATVHNVQDKSLEDRMESFFLSETCKYLFLLFDKENPVNKHYEEFLFTTEGHMFPIDERFRDWTSSSTSNTYSNSDSNSDSLGDDIRTFVDWIRPASSLEEEDSDSDLLVNSEDLVNDDNKDQEDVHLKEPSATTATFVKVRNLTTTSATNKDPHCLAFPLTSRFILPIRSQYLKQLYLSLDVFDDLRTGC